MIDVRHADSREAIRVIPDESIDAVVTDPPYDLKFMGKAWDTGEAAHDPAFWREVLRTMKPGAHLVAFAGTRTYHRLACAIEDAGFEIRDMVSWIYGSGFPKSHDVGKGIDKLARGELVRAKLIHFAATRGINGAWLESNGVASGASFADWTKGGHVPNDENWRIVKDALHVTPEEERAFERRVTRSSLRSGDDRPDHIDFDPRGSGERERRDEAATPEAAAWEGWGTALKPAQEPIVLARKPLGTSGVNVLEMVEFGLRNQGVEGKILWTSEPASAAEKVSRARRSSSTVPPPAAVTSAVRADASGTASAVAPIAPSSGPHGTAGTKPTQEDRENSPEGPTPNSEPMCSEPTADSAPVAARPSRASSPSTTSTAVEPLTENPSTARSIRSSDDRAIRPDTVSFAGIATGLTGSLERVHISRNPDGSFVWPRGLPKRLEPRPLTVAANVLKYGTGALNIDGCRVEGPMDGVWGTSNATIDRSRMFNGSPEMGEYRTKPHALGRWPANVCHDGSDEVLAGFPTARAAGDYPSDGIGTGAGVTYLPTKPQGTLYADSGSAARFFYTAKADAEDRLGSKHPTVKPVDLMRWLCRLVTPPGGTILDPFAGTGTTGLAAQVEGFGAILIEREAEYVAMIRQRFAWAAGEAVKTTGQIIAERREQKPLDGLFEGIE